jgi:hypothetical protein
MIKHFFSILIFLSFAYTQSSVGKHDLLNSGARYVSGENGLHMYINIWGHVANPGRIIVEDGVDLATLLSLTGGINKGANMKKIRVYHEYPDKNGSTVTILDLSEFIKNGDRSNFIKIQPNDTFIIKQTAWSYFIEEIGTVNTIMSLINIYLNIKFII